LGRRRLADARALVRTCRGLGTPAAGRCEGSGLDLPRKQDDQYREVDLQPQGCLRDAAVDARALVWTCRGLGTPAAGRCEGSGLDLPRKQDDQYREVDFQPQGCLRAAAVAGNVRKSWKIRLTWLVAPVLSKRMLTGCGCFRRPARSQRRAAVNMLSSAVLLVNALACTGEPPGGATTGPRKVGNARGCPAPCAEGAAATPDPQGLAVRPHVDE